mgnify:CR=1 FL=1
MNAGLPFLPEQASTIAGRVDALAWALIGTSVVGFVLVSTLLIAFSIRFRARRRREAASEVGLEHGRASFVLEIVWTAIPFALFLAFFAWGASVFVAMRRPPDDALQVFAVGKRWMWKMQHLEGKREINSLHVPVGQPVKVTLTSEDVIHSFYVPAFRVKQDAVPGRYTHLWFEATRPGRYHLFCAEFCGTQHAKMIGEVVALEPFEYQAWLAGESGAALSMAEAGAELFAQLGCPSCHAGAGDSRGPGLGGLYGQEVQLASGERVQVDDDYLRRAILDPASQLVAGYRPIMPTYRGLVSEEGILQLIAYIRSLAEPTAAADEPPVTPPEPAPAGEPTSPPGQANAPRGGVSEEEAG